RRSPSPAASRWIPRRQRRCSTRSRCSSSRVTPPVWRPRSASCQPPVRTRRRRVRRLPYGSSPSISRLMTALVAAFSLQDKIEQYGAYAGIAAVFGLGILSLLYFAQAREVKRLRNWAGRAPERAAELEARVQADAQRRAAATQAPRPGAPVTPAAQQGAA